MEKGKQEISLMPKVELHVHIEGATQPETYYSLAEKNRINLPCDSQEEWKEYFNFINFNHFIEVYETAVSTIKKAEDIAFIIEKFHEHQELNNVIYSEAFLSASFLVENFGIEEILEAIGEGIQQGEEKYETRMNLIPDIARHIPGSQAKVLELALEGYKKGLFIGLGLGGIEANFPAKLFSDSYARAREAGLHVVAHAGEADGPESVWGVIRDLEVERIGHGIRSLDDPELIEHLQRSQVPIEVSPTSNYHLGIVGNREAHPIRKMIEAGLLCTVNTDDPAMFSTTIAGEFELLHTQGFSVDELYTLNRNAIDSSFASSSEKVEYHRILEEYRSAQN